MRIPRIGRGSNDAKKAGARRHGSRGVALIATLLLLSLMVAMTLGMVIAVTSDTLISGYYKTYRTSFYAGDSGVNVVRQYMLNQLVTNAQVAIGATFVQGSAPPLSGTDSTNTLANTLTQFQSTATASNRQINSGQGANSWPGSFYIVNTLAGTPGTTIAAPNCTPIFNPPVPASSGTVTPTSGPYNCGANYPTCTGTCTNFAITDFQYQFPYTITAFGQSTGNQQQLVEDSGQLVLNVHVAPSGGVNKNFAGWGMFIDQYTECDGSTLVPGTISGPVFTNGAWNFGTSGSYIFTDKIGSVSPTFGYQFSGNCDQSAATSDKYQGQTIAPTFQSGTNLGANKVLMPTDSFNQEEAVVDGIGTGCTGVSNCPTKTTLHANLLDITGAPYPMSGSAGVYLGYTQTISGGVTTNTMTGGGILVEGNAAVTLTASTAGANAVQVYTITNNGTTTTVTIDNTAKTTTVKSGVNTTVITGVPANRAGSTATPGTMLYVDGNITSLAGPTSGAAVQDGYATTVTAASNITITGNILYKTEPVTMTQNQIPNTPADTLIPGNSNGQVLGIFTAGGNVNLGLTTSGQNLEIDASIATISQGGSGGIVNTGQAINTLNIVGGRIQNTIQNINAGTRNVFFDRRFTQGNFAPPWFPSTTITGSLSDSVTSVNSTAQRTQWVSPIS